MAFNPAQYKATTRQQWDDAAEAWHRWGPTLETWLGPATEKMLDAANVTTGGRVLDVAAGTGGQTLTAARRVGPSGRVLATDISAQDSLVRRQGGGRGRARQRGDPRGRRRSARRPAGGVLRRRDLPARAQLLPRPAGRPRRHPPGAARRRQDCGHRLFHAGTKHASSPSPSRSSGRRPSSRRPSQASQDPSALARRGSLSRPSAPPASRTSESRPSPHHCAWHRRPSASPSSGSRSAPCTRCSPAYRRPTGRPCGTRSSTPSGSSRPTTASSPRANYSSRRQPPEHRSAPHTGQRSALVRELQAMPVGDPPGDLVERHRESLRCRPAVDDDGEHRVLPQW